jgi:mercuric ion binding protein
MIKQGKTIIMKYLLALSGLTLVLLGSGTAFAAQRTVTLAVENMYCEACPLAVKKSISAVPGVGKVEVSYKDKTAVVTYDDTKADVKALTAATTNAGYPSSLKM